MIVRDLTLKQAAGQILTVGFEGKKLPVPLMGALMKGDVGGVIIFRRNIESADQLRALTGAVNGLKLKYPAWVAVDQEGGKVQRLSENVGLERLPSAMEVGKMSEAETREFARGMARDIKSFGFNMNFAPVLDIHTNPENPIIGDRAYGTTPESVTEHAIAVMRGHLDEGIVPCGKHFPGHGDTSLDSHLETPVVGHSIERLREVELKPFKAAIDAGIPMIMSAHIVMQGLGERFPSTLSPVVIHDILRGELGFEGVIVSDDLEMGAIIDNYSIFKAILLGLKAGVDQFLICKSQYLWENLSKQLVEEAKRDAEVEKRIFEAAERVISLKERFLA